MIKIDAVSFSFAGDKYIGRSYKEMDCQAFIEQCMADCGLRMDLAGSNAWYREVKKNGWVGSPEECIKIFGSIPKGALLFIHAFDGGEEKRGYHDGLGNASHVGIVTHRNDGAIHSSSSRGCVATSVFKDKTIKNGGWNMVGLWNRIDYGKSINWILEHIGIGQAPAADQDPAADPDPVEQEPAEGGKTMRGKVIAEYGGTVKLRQKPSSSCSMYWDIAVGTEMDVLQRGEEWSKCKAGIRTGWMKNEYIQLIEDPAADQDPVQDPDPAEDFNPGNMDDGDQVTLRLDREEATLLLAAVDKLSWQLVQQLGGRG